MKLKSEHTMPEKEDDLLNLAHPTIENEVQQVLTTLVDTVVSQEQHTSNAGIGQFPSFREKNLFFAHHERRLESFVNTKTLCTAAVFFSAVWMGADHTNDTGKIILVTAAMLALLAYLKTALTADPKNTAASKLDKPVYVDPVTEKTTPEAIALSEKTKQIQEKQKIIRSELQKRNDLDQNPPNPIRILFHSSRLLTDLEKLDQEAREIETKQRMKH